MPIRRANITELPESLLKPMPANAATNFASSAATTMSAPAITPTIPPAHTPCTAATIGASMRCNRARPECSVAVHRLMFFGRLSMSPMNALMSPPKLNALPSAEKSTARTPGSSDKRIAASHTSAHSTASMGLPLAGLVKVKRAKPLSTVSDSWVNTIICLSLFNKEVY